MKHAIKGQSAIEIHAPIQKVWDALTTPSIIKQYFFNTDVESTFEKGSPIIFHGQWKGKQYEDKGTILESDAPNLFKYRYWSSMSGIEDKPENYMPVTYALESAEKGTRLTIIQENIPDEQTRDHSVQNWANVLNDLKKLLESTPVPA